jgi:FMN phosphatase YigB (HAD superfamily)
MQTYILFDLDGTMLPMDTETFLAAYLRLLGASFADIESPDVFARHVMESSVATMRDPAADLTNKQKFMKRFIPRVGRSEEELLPRFDLFYRDQFPALARHAKPSPLARVLAQSALSKGHGIVMATNPVFPREAVLERMRWAGIEDLPWAHITSYEDTKYCKPNPKYFAEILETLGADAARCIHIGNDMEEDFSATRVGLPVVMVSDFLINRDNRPLTDCLYHGTLADVTQWFNNSQ